MTYSLSANNFIDCDEVKCYPTLVELHTHTHTHAQKKHNLIEDISWRQQDQGSGRSISLQSLKTIQLRIAKLILEVLRYYTFAISENDYHIFLLLICFYKPFQKKAHLRLLLILLSIMNYVDKYYVDKQKILHRSSWSIEFLY